ncbi:MAG: hypothetical protein H5T65_12395 [Chloroflexi bacterium]|nr:hypothetical protein [Chloroflexota bacterium]
MYRQPLPPEPDRSNRRLLIAALIVGAVALACAAAALVGGLMLLRNRQAAAPLPTPVPTTATPAFKTQIRLEPESGALGTPVFVRGSGWVPGEVVVVFLLAPSGNINESLTVAVAVTDEQGGFEKSFTVPKGPPWDGMAELTVLARSNRTGNEARAAFQVVPPTSTPTATTTRTLTATPTPGTPTPTPTVATPTPTRTPFVATDWLGEYWANPNLSGDPALQRNDVRVDFAWGTAAPDPVLPADRFSARWSRELAFDEGAYIFHVAVDDGARLWVDQRLIIDEWHDSGLTEYTAPLYLTAGRHFIRMEYYDAVDNAVAKLWWTPLTQFAGWKGEYYENRDLAGAPVLVRDEPQIDFDWGEGAPAGLTTPDRFSVRWTRTLSLAAGVYRFRALADDGVRLWVDDQLLIDEWHDSLRRAYVGEITLQAGAHTVRVEYYENTGGAACKVWWDVSPLPTATATPRPTFTATAQPLVRSGAR